MATDKIEVGVIVETLPYRDLVQAPMPQFIWSTLTTQQRQCYCAREPDMMAAVHTAEDLVDQNARDLALASKTSLGLVTTRRAPRQGLAW